MSPRWLALLLFFWTASAGPAFAQTHAYDAFAYPTPAPPVTTSLAGNTGSGSYGFGGSYTEGFTHAFNASNQVIGSGLQYAGLAVSGNGVYAPDTSGSGFVYRSLALPGTKNYGVAGNTVTGDSGTIWASFLMQPIGDATDTAFGGIALVNNATGGSGEPVLIGDLQGFYGLEVQGGGFAHDRSEVASTGVASPSTAGAVTMLVVKYAFTAGIDTLTLYVNPTISSGQAGLALLPPERIASIALNTDFNRIEFIQGGRAYQFDEFRLGSSFADVAPLAVTPVPEPSTYAAAALALAAIMLMRRRQLACVVRCALVRPRCG